MSQESSVTPPDGGIRSWIIVLSSFLCNGVIFGIVNTYSVIYIEFYEKLKESGIEEASSKASLIGSLTIGTTFLLSPVSGILTDRIGIQLTTFLGAILAAIALFVSSFLTDQVGCLFLTYGVLFGIGCSLTYTPSLAILGHYFKRYLGIVNGLVTAGSSLFTVAMPFVISAFLQTGLSFCLRCEAFLLCSLMICSFAFKPLYKNSRTKYADEENQKGCMNVLVNTKIWRNKRYVLWAAAVPLALFGYFVPYVHTVKFVEDNFPGRDGKLPVVCIAISSGVGKLVFGKISDYKNVDRIFLQQLSLFVIGVMTILVSFVPNYSVVLVIFLIMGLFDGCFVSMIGPIAFDICGQSGAAQGIGFLLGFCSLPIIIGPPVAGLMYDRNKSYTLPFVLSGIPPLIGTAALNGIRYIPLPKIEEELPERNQLSKGEDNVEMT